jgi:hypothetical protein
MAMDVAGKMRGGKNPDHSRAISIKKKIPNPEIFGMNINRTKINYKKK